MPDRTCPTCSHSCWEGPVWLCYNSASRQFTKVQTATSTCNKHKAKEKNDG